MKNVELIDQRGIDHFVSEGFLHLENVIPEELLQRFEANSITKEFEASIPQGKSGSFSRWFDRADTCHPYQQMLAEAEINNIVSGLCGGRPMELNSSLQIVKSIAPTPVEELLPHIDGLRISSEKSCRPGSFTVLVCVMLSDQERSGAGNLLIWPGSHLTVSRYLAYHGAHELVGIGQKLAHFRTLVPTPVCGRRGDVFLLHYLLVHAAGPNESSSPRRALYARVRARNHRDYWQTCVVEPFYEFGVSCQHSYAQLQRNEKDETDPWIDLNSSIFE